MVRKKSILKDALREISLNKKKFISLLLIIIIGAGFYVGLKMTPVDMKRAASKYYNETNLFDLKIVSSTGFSKSDKYTIKSIPGIKGVSLSKTLDVITTINNNDYVIRLNSISEDRSLKSEDYINHLTLIKGRYPKTINEGLVEERFLNDNNLSLDDLVTLKPEEKNDLRAKKIKIVGVVKSSYYSSKNRGTSNLKNGKVNYFMYLEEGDFNTEYYNEGYVTIAGANKYNTYQKEYDNYISKYSDAINEKIMESTVLTHQKNMERLNDDITSLNEKLNRLNETDLPTLSLNDSIKEVSEELEKKKEKLSSTAEPLAYSIKRSEIPSFDEYKMEIKRIENINKVFPLIFFLVTTLVSLYPITRMIEEDKIEIGTLRTIGYSKALVAFKYILYAFLASFLGCIIGIILFYKTIPLLIGCCYNAFYDIPTLTTSLQIKHVLFVIITSCVLTILACIFKVIKETKKPPAELMKSKIPKKRIFFEKIDKIWSRLSFLNKTTIKNIFKNKKRIIMAIIGICCSTALILTSFGIKDSIIEIVDNQFDKIKKYDMVIEIANNITEGDKIALQNNLINNNDIKKLTYIYKSNVTIKNNDNNENAYLIVPNNKKEINNFITLKTRKEKKNLTLNNNGIIISEKLSKQLNVKRGEKLNITLQNNKKIKAKISDITENYIDNYVYMSPTLYKKISGKEANYTTMLTINKKLNDKKEQDLQTKISSMDNITNIELISNIKENYKNMMNTLNCVIIILICFASVLAFIVLHNLASINIRERKRELATIKALGFYNKEVTNYIYKENIIITIIGSLIGLIVGSFLTYYVIKTCETNIFLFSFNINLKSYILSFLITMILLFIINALMYFKLKKLNMVDLLKGYE